MLSVILNTCRKVSGVFIKQVALYLFTTLTVLTAEAREIPHDTKGNQHSARVLDKSKFTKIKANNTEKLSKQRNWKPNAFPKARCNKKIK